MKFLVIDDDEINHKVLDAMLSKLGIEVVKSYSIYPLVDYIGDLKIDAIFMDLGLQGESGLDFIRHAYRDKYSKIPLVVVSGNAGSSIIAECLKLGALDYIIKPIDKNLLLSTVEKVIAYYDASYGRV